MTASYPLAVSLQAGGGAGTVGGGRVRARQQAGRVGWQSRLALQAVAAASRDAKVERASACVIVVVAVVGGVVVEVPAGRRERWSSGAQRPAPHSQPHPSPKTRPFSTWIHSSPELNVNDDRDRYTQPKLQLRWEGRGRECAAAARGALRHIGQAAAATLPAYRYQAQQHVHWPASAPHGGLGGGSQVHVGGVSRVTALLLAPH